MLKFNLVVNEKERDGFRLSTQADTEKEAEIIKDLITKLIGKITKIEVKVVNGEGY